jgi:hypothetical protein
MENLGAILGWKFDNVPGIKTVDDILIEWPISLGALPTDDQIQTWATEYLAHLSAIEATENQKNQDFITNLPSWVQVSTAVDNIANLADAKVFIKKLTRVVYWLAKNTSD